MKFIYSLFLLILLSFNGFGQAAGDFQSHQTGNWDVASTWERYNGASWVTPAPSTPTSANGVITILNGHTVTVVADVTADQLTVANGGILALDPSPSGVPITLTINNGTGTDLTVSGQVNLLDDFIEGSVVSVSSSASVLVSGNGAISVGDPTLSNFDFQSSSTYTHNVNGGVIPFSVWGTNTTCSITGNTNNPVTGLDQAFYNFTWNCTGQTVAQNLGLTSATSFAGDFSILGTNNQNLQLNTTGTYSIDFSKNFILSGNSRINFITITPGSATLNIAGNFSYGSSGSASLWASTGTVLINVAGDFTHSAGTLTKSGASGTATIVFNGTLVQNYSSSGTATITGIVNYQVANGSILDLGTSPLIGTTSTFTLNSGGTLRVGSTDASGAIQASTSAGNIRVATASRTYTSGSTIIYNGAGAQVTGAVWSTNATLSSGNVNLTISNTSGVTMNSAITIGASRTLTLNASTTLSLGSNILTLNGSLAGTGSLVGGSSSNLTIGGTGSFGSNLNFTGTTQLNNFILNRTSSGLVTLGSNLQVSGTFNQNNGDLDINGRTLQISGVYSRSAGSLRSNSSSILTIDGSGTLPSSFSFGGGLALNTLTINRSAASLTTSASLAITNLNLLAGSFANSGTITISTAGIITRQESGSMSTAPTAATSYDVVYNISSPINTGVELPTGTTQLRNLTKQGSDILTLNSAITVNGILTVSNGSFNAGSNAIDLKGNFVSNSTSTLTSSTITFSGTTTISGSTSPVFGNITVTGTLTPTSNFQINGNLANNGTLNSGSGTVTFGGTTTISGSSTCSFNNVTISGTLTAPSGTVNVAGNFTDNGTFNNSSGTIVFNGTTSISGSSTPSFNHITISGILNSPSSLNLAGNFTNNGTFNRSTGTVLFNGSSIQLIQGSVSTTFNNMTVSNAGGPPGVRTVTNTNLAGILSVSNNCTFDADGVSGSVVFTLLSSADNPTTDASIAALGTGAVVSGKVKAQRYMAIEGPSLSLNRIYRYISSPVQNATVADLQNEIPVTGTFTTPSSCSGCAAGNQSMWSYNEAVSGSLNLGYVDFPSTSNTETFVPAVGYNLYVRGNVLSTPVWDLTGPINSGTINFNVTYHSFGSPTNDGWNLVGNPYPSTIDWNASSGWTKTNLSSTIYMRDNGTGGVVATWNGLTGTNGGSRYIAMGQGFWVQTTSGVGSPSLIATENVKSAGTSTIFFREPTLSDLLKITMVQGANRDESVIHFRNDATAEYDNLDAWKWKNSIIFNLSSMTNSGAKLAINSLASFDCSATVKLDVSEAPVGSYSLEFAKYETFDNSITILLNDKFTNSTFDIRSGGVYAFSVTSAAQSYGADRFSIVFASPIIDSKFSVKAMDVCSNHDASIAIVGSKPGISYSVYKDGQQLYNSIGNGVDINVSITQDKLQSGANSFVIKSFIPSCTAVAAVEKTVTINNVPISEINSVTSTKSCLAGSVSMEASGALANGPYNWYESVSASTPIPNQSSSTFRTPVLQNSKTYFVTQSNVLGCEGARKPILAEVIQFDPVEFRPSDVCSNRDASITIVGSKQNIHYSIYKDSQLLSDTAGTGADLVINITHDKLQNGVNLFVLKSSIPSCSTVTPVEKMITINSFAISEIGSVTSGKSCLAGSVTLEASGAVEDYLYNWYDSEFASIPIAGELTSIFMTPVLQKSKTYYVTQSNALGCEGIRKPVLAEIIQFDPVEINEQIPDVLQSSYGVGNQWYQNGQIISGATNPIILPKSAGQYMTMVDLGNGCFTSSEFNYTGSGSSSENVIAYPNPVINILNVFAPSSMVIDKSVILNGIGEEIGELYFKKASDGKQVVGEFDMSNASSGVYLLKLDFQNGQSVHYNIIKK